MNILQLQGMAAPNIVTAWGTTTVSHQLKKFREDLSILLLTKKGTMIGDPNYGSNLHQLLFQPASNGTAAAIREEIRDCVETYFDNTRVNYINVSFIEDRVEIELNVRILNSTKGDLLYLTFTRTGGDA